MVVSEHYLERLNFVAKAEPLSRQRAVQTLYGRGMTIESKNRALRDIYHLFKDDWLIEQEPNWNFIDIKNLLKTDDRDHLPEHIEEQNWNKLINEIDKAKQQTFDDFDDLKNQFIPFDKAQEYIDWFYLYQPYLIQDLPATPAGWKSATERLDWFLDQAPDDQGCPNEMLDDAAIRYMTQWYVLNNKRD